MQFFKILIIISFSVFCSSCLHNDEFNSTIDEVSISIDTLFFDTVFSQQTTQTRLFTIKNNKNKIVIIKKAFLENNNSNFVLSMNGIQANSDNTFENIEIEPNDSIFVFVKLNIQTQISSPFYNISNKLILQTIRNQEITIFASILNAKRLSKWVISKDTILDNSYSYMVMDSITVDSACTLTLKEGVNFYMNNKSIIIVKGNLNINGTLQKPVIFQSNKIEGWKNFKDFYKKSNMLWKGIEFRKSGYSHINYANFLNADTTLNCHNNDSIIITNSKFHYNTTPIKLNKTKYCLIANSFLINSEIAFYSINSKCELFYNTIVNYSSYYANMPLININESSNTFYCQNSIIVDFNNINAKFNLTLKNYIFNTCILNKIETDKNSSYYWYCIGFEKTSILFKENLSNEVLYGTFHLVKRSIAIDKQNSLGPLFTDYYGTPRNVITDIGAIEFIE